VNWEISRCQVQAAWMASSDAMLMNSHSTSPVATVRQPTTRNARSDSEVPIRNKHQDHAPVRDSESSGDQAAMAGT
jgi:hypothetical protein